VSNGPVTRRNEKADREYQVEIQPSPVPDAAQRQKRAISLALKAASRGDAESYHEVAQSPKCSSYHVLPRSLSYRE
jgi:hypothetical protein